jgi:hypothetical protein
MSTTTQNEWIAAREMVRKEYPRSFVRSRQGQMVGSGGDDSFGPTTVFWVALHPEDWTDCGIALTEESAWLEAARGLHLIPDPSEGSYYRRDLAERFGARS